MTQHVLVTGAYGQIGTELVAALLAASPDWTVVALAHRTTAEPPSSWAPRERVVLERGDVCDARFMAALCERCHFVSVYHLAGVLSAAGEADRDRCWAVNVDSLRSVLELAVIHRFRLFWASSIAVFGPSTPRVAPQEGPCQPASLYGVAKVAGELLLAYYAQRHGVDARGLRFPGLVSSEAEPGGGTTDYSCAFYKEAVERGRWGVLVCLFRCGV
jgi:nucleoside-diphosphate-sugar epimerase